MTDLHSISAERNKADDSPFLALDWARRLLDSPTTFRRLVDISYLQPIRLKNRANSYFYDTLLNREGIKRCICLSGPPLKHATVMPQPGGTERMADGQQASTQKGSSELSLGCKPVGAILYSLISLGTDLAGHQDTAHGGFISTMLDELMGIVNFQHKFKPCFTAYLHVEFVAPLKIPCDVLLVKTWIDKEEGRKRFTKGVIEDGEGFIYARANALFVEWKEDQIAAAKEEREAAKKAFIRQVKPKL